MKKRRAVWHELENLWKEHQRQFEDLDVNLVHLYLDMTDPEIIIEIRNTNATRFKHIIYEIFKRTGNNELYRRVGEGVYEMRFNGRPNSRILCKEVKEPNTPMKIVMCKGIKNKGTTGKKLEGSFKEIEKYSFDFYLNYQEYEKEENSQKAD